MKSFADAILTAQEISTKKEKHEALSGLNDEGVRLLLECENPFRVFGIRKWDKPEVYADQDPVSFSKFFDVLDALHDRRLTGNAAKAAVTAILGTFTERTASVLERVIKGDLKCGANTKTFETVYPQLKVPFYDLMLCGKIEHVKNEKGEIVYPKYNWTFPCLGEVKYDGNRLIAYVENGEVTYTSRSGKPADEWNGLFDDELIAMEKAAGYPIIVDGEALSIEGFQATSKAKGSKNDKSNMRFFAFDMMALSSWKAQSCPVKQSCRTINLEKMINDLGLVKIIKSKSRILNNLDEAKAFYTEVIEDGLPGQDEGLIIKDLNGLYEWNSKKRTLTWAKWKPVIDVDVTIVGFYYGSKGTKNEFRLGGFHVEGVDENGNKIKSKCGGFKVNSKKFKDWIAKFDKKHDLCMQESYNLGISKDEFFRTLAVNKFDELFKGATCTIETQELSLADGSTTYALRFPQFIMLRDDK
jgi:hypothetical protein